MGKSMEQWRKDNNRPLRHIVERKGSTARPGLTAGRVICFIVGILLLLVAMGGFCVFGWFSL
jgi:hypothetical protein